MMATNEGRNTASEHLSPFTLSDGSTVPTVIPPPTEFPDVSERVPKDDTPPKLENMTAQQPADSYFGENPNQEERMNPVTTRTPNEDAAAQPATRRTNTAPAHGVKRRAPFSSLPLAGVRRRATGLNEGNQDPYSYTFDPLSSDSDSTSSSEDEAPQKKGRPQRPQQQVDGSDDQTQQERRRQAKRGHSYSRFKLDNEQVKTKGRVSKRDGRLNISINETANRGYIARALGQSIKHHLNIPSRHEQQAREQEVASNPPQATRTDDDAESVASSLRQTVSQPRLNIVIMVIGSRGDIQPFLKIGKILKQDYGHRVRIASHPTFRDFVQEENGLEFFSVGGDPSELMAFMVKNPGLIPSLQTLREGEVQRRRAAMGEMFEGFWRACINTTDDEKDKDLSLIHISEPTRPY